MQKLKAGDLVRVRRARWRIVNVRPYDGCQIVTLAGVGRGGERRVIAPFETIEPADTARRLRIVGRRKWRRVCRELLASHTPPGALRCGRLARMELLPHQLEPALAILRGLGSRLLLADDVGLGKTLQAALAIEELRAREFVDRVLILTPAGVRDQWSEELARRFGIDAAIVDAADVRRRVAALPIGVNPWTTTPVAIASIDYIKRADVLPSVAARRWDVVVIDEAHNVAGDSDRFSAASALCARAAYVLLLTATPHSGDRRAFTSLCGIGAQAHDDPILIFRRTRADVRLGVGRRVRRLLVRPSPQEQRMHALLARFTRAVRDEHGDAATLPLSVLHKRALSSPRSLERSIGRRLACLAVDAAPSGHQLLLPLDDGNGELNVEDELPAWREELSLADSARERRMLEALRTAANDAAADETKVRALRRLLRRVAEPVIVFTEYRDTLFHLRDSLNRPVLLLHGGLTRDERTSVLAAFSSGRCTTLLATDAAGEGLNLHQRCRFVVNLELPWNPMRLEQRIGRVDRIGQGRTVHAIHLIARDTDEPRILDRLKTRIARARIDLDVPDPIGFDEERRVAAMMVGARSDIDATQITQPQAPPSGCVFPHLASEAIAEAARLTHVRALSGLPIGTDASGPGVTRARHRVTRARLRGRTLLLMRIGCDDGEGRATEAALIPVTLREMDMSALLDAPLAALEDLISSGIAEVVADWQRDATAIAAAFWLTRLRRERTILAEASGCTFDVLQPGLFDQRVLQVHDAAMAGRLDGQHEQQARLIALERAATLSFLPPRILLAMTP
jgi:superfamily II DNA or RNA helicase